MQNVAQHITPCFNMETDVVYKPPNNTEEVASLNKCIVNFKNYQLFKSRCIIETTINDYKIDTLVDTGADACYISYAVCVDLQLPVQSYDCEVIVGNNQKLPVIGKIQVNVIIGDYEYLVGCTVVEILSHPLILGWLGFIKEYDGMIDAKAGKLELNVPSNQIQNFAFLQENTILPP